MEGVMAGHLEGNEVMCVGGGHSAGTGVVFGHVMVCGCGVTQGVLGLYFCVCVTYHYARETTQRGKGLCMCV